MFPFLLPSNPENTLILINNFVDILCEGELNGINGITNLRYLQRDKGGVVKCHIVIISSLSTVPTCSKYHVLQIQQKNVFFSYFSPYIKKITYMFNIFFSLWHNEDNPFISESTIGVSLLYVYILVR